MTPEQELPPTDDLRADVVSAFENTPPADDGSEALPSQAPEPVEPAASEAGQPSVAGDRPRDAQGRFIPRDPSQLADQAVQRASTAVPAGPPQTQAAPSPVGPPPGWSPQSKLDYAKLPEHVKHDIAKRESEISAGFAKLSEYKGIDPYVEMARNSGTTLPEALARYVNAENALEADPVNGLLWLCHRYQIHPGVLYQRVAGQGQNGQGQQPQRPDPLQERLQQVDQRLQQFEFERERAEDEAINSQIFAFSQDPQHPYYENVRHIMADIIRQAPQNKPLTLKSVYEEACWAHPEVREALINERVNGNRAQNRVRDQNRAASSLSPGSPVPGGTFQAQEPAATLREEIERAFESQRV